MSQPDNKSKRAVIVFNKKCEYVAVIASITQAALIQGVNKKLIYYNCIGKSIMVGNFYFRFYLSELGLTLSDLDNLCWTRITGRFFRVRIEDVGAETIWKLAALEFFGQQMNGRL